MIKKYKWIFVLILFLNISLFGQPISGPISITTNSIPSFTSAKTVASSSVTINNSEDVSTPGSYSVTDEGGAVGTLYLGDSTGTTNSGVKLKAPASVTANYNIVFQSTAANGIFSATLSGSTLTLTSVSSVIGPLICSDESTAITASAGKLTFRMPFSFTLTGVRASLTTAQASGNIFTVDIHESGTTVLSTAITIDNTEKTSTTAATAAVISDSSLADDAEITIDVDQIGNGTATGLRVWLIGTRN